MAITAISALQVITLDHPQASHLEQVQRLASSGVDWIQLRVKDRPVWEVRRIARLCLNLCRDNGICCIINDLAEICAEIDADGVHLGRRDMPVEQARDLLGGGKIIGATANTYAEVAAAAAAGADYVGVGPFRYTRTKRNLSPLLGLAGYAEIVRACEQDGVEIPIIAIGGIIPEDSKALRQTGIDGIAVSSAIHLAEDPLAAVRAFLQEWGSAPVS